MTLLFSEHGHRVGCYDYDSDAVHNLMKEAKEAETVDNALVHGFTSLQKLVDAFPTDGETPRMFVLSLPHGKAVDGIMDDVLPLLSKGDIVIDAGNEWWEDTERRQRIAREKGVEWVGMGVSGGCEWASVNV
jgi:6-phosphogluconate dehydrogenase